MIIVTFPESSGGSGADAPRFSWSGLVNFVDTTPAWRVVTAASLVRADVDMATATAAITFNILVNGTNVQTVSATATAAATYTITAPVVAGDKVRIQVTSVGTGACHDLSILLREI